MKSKFWLCKRGDFFYLIDSDTGQRTSLKTGDKTAAEKILQPELAQVAVVIVIPSPQGRPARPIPFH